MNQLLEKYVESKFMTAEQGEYIEQALVDGKSVIIAGHRSAGCRPFMAALMMLVGKLGKKGVPIKNVEDAQKEGDYLLLPGIDGVDFEALVKALIAQKDKNMITVKEPEHPYSLLKLIKDAYKEDNSNKKTYVMVECSKENGVPYVSKITKMYFDEDGKVKKEDL